MLADPKKFTCCRVSFTYYPELDIILSDDQHPPEKAKPRHSCEKLSVYQNKMTFYFQKHIKVESACSYTSIQGGCAIVSVDKLSQSPTVKVLSLNILHAKYSSLHPLPRQGHG